MKRIAKGILSRFYNSIVRWTTTDARSVRDVTYGGGQKPPAREIRSVLYSPQYQIVFGGRFSVFRDTVNGVYPFPIDPAYTLQFRLEEINGLCTSFRSRWNNHYHLLIDLLPRVLQLHRSEFSNLGPIKLLSSGDLTPNEEYLLQRLDLPDFVTIETVRNGLCSVDRYLFLPFLSTTGSGAVPDWYLRMIRERVCPSRPRRKDRRILISRQSARKRRILNFQDLEAALIPIGFSTVAPEELTFREQVELFYDAEAVVGSHGAGLVNLLFSNKACVVEIMPADMKLRHYSDLCDSLGNPYAAVFPTQTSSQLLYPSEGRIASSDLRRFEKLRDRYVDINPHHVVQALASLGIS